jgi:hypothetical protein
MPLPLKEHIFIDQAVRGWQNPTVLESAAAEQAKTPWCTNPHDYNFVADFLDKHDFLSDYDFQFTNHKCAAICSHSTVDRESCMHPPETWIKEGKNELMLLTAVRDRIYHANGTAESKAFLLPFAEFLSVAFKISYEELDRTILRLGHTARSVTGRVLKSADFAYPTKFISSCGETIKEISPGEDLVLSVPELFALVCHKGYLDAIQPSAGTNLASGAKYATGALGRIVGVEIAVSIFINDDTRSAEVSARLIPVTFVGGTKSETFREGDGIKMRLREYNGIRVRLTSDGIQTVFDLNNVILNVSALVVYLSLPIIIIKFFAVYGLGHLSKIYRGVVYSKFNIAVECGAMATRLMGSSATFHQLEDVADANGDGILGDTGISRKVMKAYVTDVMQHRGKTLDAEEISQFVELAFNEVDIDINPEAADTAWGNIKAAIIDYLDIDATHHHKNEDRLGPACINIDEFNMAFHSAFPISFDSVVKLFDKDRRQSFLERAFTPDKLKQALTKAKFEKFEHGDDDDDDSGPSPQVGSIVIGGSQDASVGEEESTGLRDSADASMAWRNKPHFHDDHGTRPGLAPA